MLGPVEVWAEGRCAATGPPQRRGVLAGLLADAGRLVTTEALIGRVWGEEPPASARRTLHAHVARIRGVLAHAGAPGAPVLTHRSGGYVLEVDIEAVDLHRFRRLVGLAREPGCAPEQRALLLGRAVGLWRGEALAGVGGEWAQRTRRSWRHEYLDAMIDWAKAQVRSGDAAAAVGPMTDLAGEHPLVEPVAEALIAALHAAGRTGAALEAYTAIRRRLAEELGTDPGPDLRALQQAILRSRAGKPTPVPATPVPAMPVPAMPVPATSVPAMPVPATSVPAMPVPATSVPATPAAATPAAPILAPSVPALTAAAGATTGATRSGDRGRAVPAQLPAEVSAFTGRRAELAELHAFLDQAGAWAADEADPADAAGAPTVVISAVSGTAGVGKTALAVRWAHRVVSRFPDGQLYVNLRGYDPDRPMTPGDALAGFLSALGVPGPDIPLDLAARAARFRTETAGRRILLVLDNAASVEQVRPLLPGSGSCAVVVTSRDSLAGLVAAHGARRIDLDLLPAEDAVALLRRLIGARVDAEPAAAATLAGQCARLPLALRVAAELAVARPGITLAELARELADRQHRLELLDAGGDPRAAVHAVFSWSVQHLAPDAVRALGLLGLHPAADFDAYAAAALAGTSIAQARRTVDLLARAHLLQPGNGGRYGMHDLLRAYATTLSGDGSAAGPATAGGPATAEGVPGDPANEQQAALGRLFDHYLATAAAAMDLLHAGETHRRPRVRPATTPVPPLPDPDTARAWLDAERPTLVAVAAYTAEHGWPDHTSQLSGTLFRYLAGGHYTDALAVHGHARRAAVRAGDLAGESGALTNLGTAHGQLGRHDQAIEYFREALARSQQAGDFMGQGRALGNLGLVEQRLGRYGSAATYYRRAHATFGQAEDRTGQAFALTGVGFVEQRLGRYQPAADLHRQALAVYRQVGSRDGEAHVLTNLGDIEQRLGRYGAAAEHFRQALSLTRELGNRTGQADVLSGLGDLHTRLGQPDLAAEHFEQALALFRDAGDRRGEAWALNGLGEAAHAAGNPTDALTHHAAAHNAATDTGARDQQARAHAGLGHARQALADPTRARQHFHCALSIYTDIGSPEATQIRAHLAALDQAGGTAAPDHPPSRAATRSRHRGKPATA